MSGAHNIVDSFAKYFQSSFNVIDDNSQLKGSSGSFSKNVTMTEVSSEHVFKVIKRVKANHFKEPDGIPAFFVRDCAAFVLKFFRIFGK